MRTITQQNYLENIRRVVWVKAMAAAIALATALNACSSDGNDDDGNGGSGGGGSCSISDYKTKQIGSQTWMAENLNCNVNGSVCYDNNSSNCSKYGRLYNWEQAKSACPSGWHLPSDEEWTTLTYYVGGSSTAGTKLKATSGWNGGNGTDDYGFSALPGGSGTFGGSFYSAGLYGDWWSSTENGILTAYNRHMNCYIDYVLRNINDKGSYYSVRCVKD